MLPATPVVEQRINALEPASWSFPGWNSLLETTFRFLPTTARFPGCHWEIDAPGLSLRISVEFRLNPFGLPLHRLGPVCPKPWRLQCNRPVAQPRPNVLKCYLSLRSPLGFYPFQIEAFSPIHHSRSSPLCPARFPFAPRVLSISSYSRINVPGSLPFTRLAVL